jgi:hypothetical protein
MREILRKMWKHERPGQFNKGRGPKFVAFQDWCASSRRSRARTIARRPATTARAIPAGQPRPARIVNPVFVPTGHR